MRATENVADVSKETFSNALLLDVYTYLNFLQYSSAKSKELEAMYKQK